MLVDADGVVVGEAEHLSDAVRIEEVIKRNHPTHAVEITFVAGSFRPERILDYLGNHKAAPAVREHPEAWPRPLGGPDNVSLRHRPDWAILSFQHFQRITGFFGGRAPSD